MKLLQEKPEELIEMDENPNELKGEKYEQLKREIERVGFINPIICRRQGKKLIIVGGTHRRKAAIELNLAKVPVVVIDISEKEALNQLINLNGIHGEPDNMKLHELYKTIFTESKMDIQEIEKIFLPEESILKKLQEIEEEEKKKMKDVEFVAKDDSPLLLSLSFLGEEKKLMKEAMVLTGIRDERLAILEIAKFFLENYGGKK